MVRFINTKFHQTQLLFPYKVSVSIRLKIQPSINKSAMPHIHTPPRQGPFLFTVQCLHSTATVRGKETRRRLRSTASCRPAYCRTACPPSRRCSRPSPWSPRRRRTRKRRKKVGDNDITSIILI